MQVKEDGQPDKVYYAHTDHLGSIVKLTDKDGTEVFAATYDAWGKQTITNTSFDFYRGYTGQEHLPEFGLINMNGRMYDPVLGRMLSADNYIQEPYNSQSYNRYSYVFNNPLRYTDPTGMLTWNDVIAGVSLIGGTILSIVVPPLMPYVGAPLIAAGFSHFAYTVDMMENNPNMSWNDASNIAGFQFSTTININKPTQQEKNLYQQNKPNYSGDVKVEKTTQDSRFFTGSYYEASKLLSYLSKEDGVERIMYETDLGYYFEPTNGYLFMDLSTATDLQINYSYWGKRENGKPIYYVESTINGTYPFAISKNGENLYLNLGMGNKHKITGFYHTHPGNTMLSLDDPFQGMQGVRVRAIGWDGFSRGSYFDNGYYTLDVIDIVVRP